MEAYLWAGEGLVSNTSSITVTQPGIYELVVFDYCATSNRDTVIVSFDDELCMAWRREL